MEQHRLQEGALLDKNGYLAEAGYATSLVRTYDRGAIRAKGFRVKEWDYYLIYNDRYGIALTIDDNAYMGLVSASFLDFTLKKERTVSPMFWFPFGKTGFPSSSAAGDVKKSLKGAAFSFTHENGARHLKAYIENFENGKPFSCDFLLTDPPRDTMVIATPFAGHPRSFYYNQKIIGMRADGTAEYDGKSYRFDGADTFGLLDWGRGVWTYKNTWYWSAAQGEAGGHRLGFNLGYGFGDVSAASENMFFYDGIAHKLGRLTFEIPRDAAGKDDFLSPWRFTSDDGRFEADFIPFLDRASCTDALLIKSDQHQVFGRFTGRAVLDDGTEVPFTALTGFAEKVLNKW